ncbi:MAG: hypothetical protein NTZ23_05435 [Cyanobium sp. LacPavin_0920_WC12_MAG_63_22]|nr:hypothetical protein [Cyanobium sp. LacPavin_0920_WC12_MAG_63_22]
MKLGLRTLVKLQQQTKIRPFRGRLAWEGDLESNAWMRCLQASSRDLF